MITAAVLFEKARKVLQDEDGIRWPLPELRLWLNDALREIALFKPSAVSRSVVMPLTRGTFQKIDPTFSRVLRATRNIKSFDPDNSGAPREGGRIVRTVDREIMDTYYPDWHDERVQRFAKDVQSVIFDQIEPTAFYVYPGNDGTGFLEVTLARIPADVPAPTNAANELTSYPGAVDIDAIYANALLDYVLYRAYSKDADFAGNAQRAAAHYSQFSSAIGASIGTDKSRNPNVRAAPAEENAA